MPDLLAFGLRGLPMIIPGLDQGTGLMRRSHVRKIILASEFKSANVLDNPTLPHTINPALAQDACAACLLPHLEPPARREFPASRRAHILNLRERHEGPPSQIK
nr:hypothetical protein [Microvirga massiliensis]